MPNGEPPPFAQRRLFNRIGIATVLQAIIRNDNIMHSNDIRIEIPTLALLALNDKTTWSSIHRNGITRLTVEARERRLDNAVRRHNFIIKIV